MFNLYSKSSRDNTPVLIESSPYRARLESTRDAIINELYPLAQRYDAITNYPILEV